MGKVAIMVPLKLGVLYILEIEGRYLIYKFCYYNSKVTISDRTVFTEENDGIHFSLFSDDDIIIPPNKSKELKIKTDSCDYFK